MVNYYGYMNVRFFRQKGDNLLHTSTFATKGMPQLVVCKIFAHIEGYPFRNGIDCGKTYIPFGTLASFIIRIFKLLSLPVVTELGRGTGKNSRQGGNSGRKPYWKVAI